jgi:hypothetical protein
MDPHKPENWEVLLSNDFNNREKLERIEADKASAELLEEVTEQAVASKIVQPLPDSTGRQLEAGGQSIEPANYYGHPVEITDIPEGIVTFDVFIYAPKDRSLGRSINVSWHLKEGRHSRLLLQEYVSDKSFVPGIAAYREDAPHVLALIQESLRAYEEALAEQ